MKKANSSLSDVANWYGKSKRAVDGTNHPISNSPWFITYIDNPEAQDTFIWRN